ncbi:hypothetical protein [Verrucosispora sioxanthis]|nr:hypothetical protein [Verrucosispora sioxanthis]
MILGGLRRAPGRLTATVTALNGSPALVVHLDGDLDGVLAVRVGEAGIGGLYYVRNPAKLTRVGSETRLVRR